MKCSKHRKERRKETGKNVNGKEFPSHNEGKLLFKSDF